MLLSVIRFWAKGWIYDLYLKPTFFFKYEGFEWISIPSSFWLYTLFFLMGICFLFISLGLFYRISCTVGFLIFIYVELLDKTNYLNHYYFVSIILFMLIWLPANRNFALDTKLWPKIKTSTIPKWCVDALKIQIAIVYIYAGLAKLNPDWILEAMPLRLWLPANNNWPVIGFLFDYKITAYLFSWFGAFYDLFIVFFLINDKTRKWAFISVVVFHVLTWLLFPIGIFPFVMISATLIFFPALFHKKILTVFFKKDHGQMLEKKNKISFSKALVILFAVHLFLQIIIPWRFLQYPGDLFWNEQGYRFSWRVMLMEKAGTAFFYVKDQKSGKESEVDNKQFLSKNQEKMMATQPDFIFQYAKMLAKHYAANGYRNPAVRVESYVTLNGSGSRLFLDTSLNIAALENSAEIYPHIITFKANR